MSDNVFSYTCFGSTYKVKLQFAKYANGRTALLLVDVETGEQFACATVNMPEYELGEDEVIIKSWSENQGMLEFLLTNRIVKDMERDIPAGHTSARVCKLLIKPS